LSSDSESELSEQWLPSAQNSCEQEGLREIMMPQLVLVLVLAQVLVMAMMPIEKMMMKMVM
jgi:hypothetical protein